MFADASQNRPVAFSAELRNIKFKESSVAFLIEHCDSDEVAELIGDKQVYISYKSCHKYISENGKVYRTNVANVNCEDLMKADTKFALFLTKQEGPKNIVIRCADTDILVITLANMVKFEKTLSIWLQFGIGHNCRFINVNEIHKAPGNLLYTSLPAFHAFTGSDFTPAFYKKGKSKPFLILEATDKYQTAFKDLADLNVFDSTKETIQEFVCEMYRTKKNKLKQVQKVNEARSRIFAQNYGMIDDMEFVKGIVYLKFYFFLFSKYTYQKLFTN